MAVYAAGYTRTRSAADQLEGQSAERRPAMPRPMRAASPAADFNPAATNAVAITVSPADSAKPTLVASVNPPAAKKADVSEAPTATAPASTPAAETAPAPAPVAASQPVAQPPAQTAAQAAYKAVIDAALPPWKDGTYEGWGTCRHGDLAVKVVI